ncbi:amino acid/polyamine transporter I, partial [Blyttiomyces helicus]
NNLNLVTGEMTDSAKNLPRAIVAGPTIVIVSYLLANVAYYAVLPAQTVGLSNTIAMEFGKEVFGHIGGIIIPLIVIGSAFGAANASIFGGARVIHVSARHGHVPKLLGAIHPTLRTPTNALLVQGLLSTLFVLLGSFTTLVNFYSMIVWSFYFLAVLGLLILRRTEPHLHRPYRVWMPVAVVFCATTVFLVAASVREAPWEAVGAAVFVGSGVPFWWIVVRK